MNLNKEFVIKFLPIGGKIKTGDPYWHYSKDGSGVTYRTLNRCHKPYRKIEGKEEYFVDGMFAKDCRKVAPYLCTREIEIGDMITLDGIEFIEYQAGEVDNIWLEHVKRGFKKVGPISWAARFFVEEEKVYREDQCEFIIFKPMFGEIKLPLDEWLERIAVDIHHVKLLGPCGHKH